MKKKSPVQTQASDQYDMRILKGIGLVIAIIVCISFLAFITSGGYRGFINNIRPLPSFNEGQPLESRINAVREREKVEALLQPLGYEATPVVYQDICERIRSDIKAQREVYAECKLRSEWYVFSDQSVCVLRQKLLAALNQPPPTGLKAKCRPEATSITRKKAQDDPKWDKHVNFTITDSTHLKSEPLYKNVLATQKRLYDENFCSSLIIKIFVKHCVVEGKGLQTVEEKLFSQEYQSVINVRITDTYFRAVSEYQEQ